MGGDSGRTRVLQGSRGRCDRAAQGQGLEVGAQEAELWWVKEPSLSSALVMLRHDHDRSQLCHRGLVCGW